MGIIDIDIVLGDIDDLGVQCLDGLLIVHRLGEDGEFGAVHTEDDTAAGDQSAQLVGKGLKQAVAKCIVITGVDRVEVVDRYHQDTHRLLGLGIAAQGGVEFVEIVQVGHRINGIDDTVIGDRAGKVTWLAVLTLEHLALAGDNDVMAVAVFDTVLDVVVILFAG